MKDNNQSANIAALVASGVRSFKIEGRYKDMAYVKNITAHYRKLLDELIEAHQHSDNPLSSLCVDKNSHRNEPDPSPVWARCCLNSQDRYAINTVWVCSCMPQATPTKALPMHTATAQSHAKLHSHQHPGSHTPAAAKSAAKPKLYNPRRPGTLRRRFANTWSAASLRTALPAPAVRTAVTTTSWPIPAKAVVSVPHATPGAWWRRRRT